METIKKLIVKYNNKVVGHLVQLNNSQIAFQYDDEWLKHGFSISPFSLPLKNEVFVNKKQTFNGLFGVFWDSLPDGWGELLVRKMLIKNGINPDKLTPLQKLSLVANNGLGGLTYEPCNAVNGNKMTTPNLDQLAMESKKILNNENDNYNLDKIYELGGSSGGARPKAHILNNNEEWIVKFPCLIDPPNIGKQEFLANKLAQECGIETSEFKLFGSKKCSGYFGTKRFDRKNNKKIHMISLSAMLETTHRLPNLDYAHLFQVINQICVKKDDLYEAYKRMCFNVLFKNRDDHGKNFAFLYDETLRGYKLSPAYDLTQTPNKPEHEMTVCGNGTPTEHDLLTLAKEFNLSQTECKKIIEIIKEKIYK